MSEPGKPSHPGAAPPTATTSAISGLPPCSRLSSPMRPPGRIAARTAPRHARTATRRSSQGRGSEQGSGPQLNEAAASPGGHRGADLRMGDLVGAAGTLRYDRADRAHRRGVAADVRPPTLARNSRAVDSSHAQRLRLLNCQQARASGHPNDSRDAGSLDVASSPDLGLAAMGERHWLWQGPSCLRTLMDSCSAIGIPGSLWEHRGRVRGRF